MERGVPNAMKYSRGILGEICAFSSNYGSAAVTNGMIRDLAEYVLGQSGIPPRERSEDYPDAENLLRAIASGAVMIVEHNPSYNSSLSDFFSGSGLMEAGDRISGAPLNLPTDTRRLFSKADRWGAVPGTDRDYLG
jgi:hypothetical protein